MRKKIVNFKFITSKNASFAMPMFSRFREETHNRREGRNILTSDGFLGIQNKRKTFLC